MEMVVVGGAKAEARVKAERRRVLMHHLQIHLTRAMLLTPAGKGMKYASRCSAAAEFASRRHAKDADPVSVENAHPYRCRFALRGKEGIRRWASNAFENRPSDIGFTRTGRFGLGVGRNPFLIDRVKDADRGIGGQRCLSKHARNLRHL